MKYKVRKPPPCNSVLEKLFLKSKGKASDKDIVRAVESLQWSKRLVLRWLRQRLSSQKLNKLDKFQESSFIGLYHIIISIYGLYVMHDKPWLLDIKYCWMNYPRHEIESGVWWYYIISVSFYWALCFSHLKSGLTEYVHHMCSILLLVFSWACNLVRVGTLVLLVHECGDILLHIGKIFNYLKKRRSTEIILGVFFVVWVTTRLGLFPFWILRSSFYEGPKYAFMPAGYVFYALLFGLLILNIIWTSMIIAIIIRRSFRGMDVNDIRSSESSVTSDENSKQD